MGSVIRICTFMGFTPGQFTSRVRQEVLGIAPAPDLQGSFNSVTVPSLKAERFTCTSEQLQQAFVRPGYADHLLTQMTFHYV